MTAAIEACDLGKRFRGRWPLRHTSLRIPTGRVVGLVGANGAGKSTLLHLAVGLLEPTEGEMRVLGDRPGRSPGHLAKLGFVAQDRPVYGSLTVEEHLTLGARLNATWNGGVAEERIARLGLDRRQRAGALSGGQRSQLALTLAIGKGPELLLLDEPVAGLDPLARRQFLQDLMESAADGVSIVLSSHLIDDLERVCDHLIVLGHGQVQLAGDVDDILAEHHLVTCPRTTGGRPAGLEVIARTDTPRQTTLLVRGDPPAVAPTWSVADVGLEEIVLAHLAGPGVGNAQLHRIECVA